MNRKMKLAAAVLLAGMTAGSVWADAAAVRVSGYFSDHMVLQRGEGTSVWGKAAPGAKVKVSFAGQSLEATIDGDGVVVTAKDVAEPVAVRYAYRANPMGAADLYNAEGLPAVPFTTEK